MRYALGTVRCFRRFISHLCYSPSSFVALINCKRLMLPDQKASREVGEAELLSTVAVSKEPGTHRLTPRDALLTFEVFVALDASKCACKYPLVQFRFLVSVAWLAGDKLE